MIVDKLFSSQNSHAENVSNFKRFSDEPPGRQNDRIFFFDANFASCSLFTADRLATDVNGEIFLANESDVVNINAISIIIRQRLVVLAGGGGGGGDERETGFDGSLERDRVELSSIF